MGVEKDFGRGDLGSCGCNSCRTASLVVQGIDRIETGLCLREARRCLTHTPGELNYLAVLAGYQVIEGAAERGQAVVVFELGVEGFERWVERFLFSREIRLLRL